MGKHCLIQYFSVLFFAINKKFVLSKHVIDSNTEDFKFVFASDSRGGYKKPNTFA